MSQIGSSLKNLNETFETTHLAVVQAETPIHWTFVEHLPQPRNKKSIKDKGVKLGGPYFSPNSDDFVTR